MSAKKCIITKLKTEQKRHAKISVYLNGQFWKSISKDVVVSLGLYKDMEIHKEVFENIDYLDEKVRALNHSLRLLGFRSRSIKEINDRLKQAGFSEAVIDVIVDELKQRGYLDDKDFARMWVKERFNSRKYGKNWVKGELLAKGIERSIIDAELSYYSDQAERDCAMFLAHKKYSESIKTDPIKQRRRLYQYLIRRGFNNSIVTEVLREVVSIENQEC